MGESIRQLARDMRRAVREGSEAIARRRQARLAELVAYARAHSPYYCELYGDLPARVDDPELLPVTSKKTLMARFDDWVTDREVTRERVEAFVADPGLVGHRFLGRYLVTTTTGTSGQRGLFVQDDRCLAVHTATGLRTGGGLSARDVFRTLARAGRTAIVTAPRGHFATVAGAARAALERPWLGRMMRVIPTDQSMERVVDELNRFDPASVAGFVGMLTLLAGEQEAGRLRIRPAVVVLGGETLTPETRERLAIAFGAKVRAAYACGECGFLTAGCEHGWYHVNSDWVVLEPVDADHRPVPPGQFSHTVLISNLANRIQPILRYDLGDSVLVRPDPCPCGSPLPAVQVQGRAADLLTFPIDRGEHVGISPMSFGTALAVPGMEQFQLVQTAPTVLRVRLRAANGADADRVWQTARDRVVHLLTEHKAGHVTIERAEEPPQQSPGGKYRRIIPLPRL
ncbi:phenylacetate-coenzyme A ligase PaaK-like adenylate-forming protein [Nonomuraea polychroma]|uniref:Phenylacetate-coenzyme A ligase PaaK-like adenylate-forming protein n=1 Tax=Nonomuraea polychroma TaxID=46176 RepID=A0A438M7Z6_9ACTN|nr:phenylacetate--CoA ligase family protein [Nonomuraea polychroma]RVX41832.1 phenylacetate-coenzyme A ligase PaaK-like adenylate-forming protein [Nonomuraea polychroma]